ncbi:MAG TPA: hypothetical protein VEW74_02975, partial [Candidatus Nitrosotalea sp.]|nr:hypothetical protein [Candidatus Nitrosotalea sp.]
MLLRRLLLSAALLTGAGCQSVGGGLAQNAFDRASSVNPNLGCTRAPCVLPNSQASATAKKPVNETAIAADPRNPQHITVEANDYNCPTGAYGASASFSSDDGGATWTSTCFAVVPNSKPRNDPDVAYDLNGTVYRAGLDVYHVARRT